MHFKTKFITFSTTSKQKQKPPNNLHLHLSLYYRGRDMCENLQDQGRTKWIERPQWLLPE